MIRAIVFDLDGVLRLWDVTETHAIERRFGLPEGAIRAAAFDSTLDHRVIVGEITDEEWREEIRGTLRAAHGAGADGAVAAWSARVGDVDRDLLEYVQALRTRVTVALLSNATSRLDRDLGALGLADAFDRVFNSSSLGVRKPDRAVFEHVGTQLSLPPSEWLFVDDTVENVEGCQSFGVDAHRYAGRAELREWLEERLSSSVSGERAST